MWMGKLGGRGRREFEKKKIFAGKLGTDNKKAIGSIANVNASFFSLKIDGVRWTGYPHPNVFKQPASLMQSDQYHSTTATF